MKFAYFLHEQLHNANDGNQTTVGCHAFIQSVRQILVIHHLNYHHMKAYGYCYNKQGVLVEVSHPVNSNLLPIKKQNRTVTGKINSNVGHTGFRSQKKTHKQAA